jgi:hypothetical protein
MDDGRQITGCRIVYRPSSANCKAPLPEKGKPCSIYQLLISQGETKMSKDQKKRKDDKTKPLKTAKEKKQAKKDKKNNGTIEEIFKK